MVETLVLPVSFQAAPALLEKALHQQNFKYVFMMGQAGGRAKICLERVALNWVETEAPDEEGDLPPLGPLNSGAPPALLTSVDLKAIKSFLKQKSLDVEISLSAGAYVCNSVYYRALQTISEKSLKTQACFIHVPYLPQQAVGKNSSQPSMEFETMRATVAEFLQFFISLN